MNIEIRLFREDDREFYLTLSKEFYGTPAVDHAVPASYFQTTFDACLAQSPYTTGLILMVDGENAGFTLLSFSYSNEVGGLVVSLEEAYILPQFQGHGLASAMFDYVEEEYVRKGVVKRLRLEVARSNTRAIALYRRMGFKELGYMQMIKDFT